MTPEIVVEARVSDDLRSIGGTLRATGLDDATWTDVLAAAPLPATDLLARRAFPGRPARGSATWTVDGDTLRFETHLPRRWAPNGRSAGVIASDGGWLPQPVVDGHAPTVRWRVTLALPDGAIGALGPAVGAGPLVAEVVGDRVGFVALAHGHVVRLDEDAADVTVLSRHPTSRRVRRELATLTDRALRTTGATEVVVAITPDRERLARATPGLVLASTRLFRVTPTLERFHRLAASEAIVAAAVPIDDPWARAVVGAARARTIATGWSARRWVQLGSFLPGLEAILYDGRTPYVGDLFEDATFAPPDPLAPIAPRATGRLAVAQLADGWGDRAVHTVTDALIAGATLEDAGRAASLPDGWLAARKATVALDDLRLDVTGGVARVTRHAAPDAPLAPIGLQVDDADQIWFAAPGEVHEVGPVDRIVVDPRRHVPQTSRLGDSWPPRWRATVSGFVETINLTDRYVEASGYAIVRRSDDPDDAITGVAWTDREQWLGLRLGWLHRLGRPIDGLVRAHRITVQMGPTVFNPALAPTDGARWAIAVSSGWTWDTRVDGWFPLRGHWVTVSGDTGLAPENETGWASLRTGAAGVLSPHPSIALVGRVGGAVATGEVAHRALALGGRDNLRAIAQGDALGDLRGTAFGEARWAPIRNASVPLLGLVWLDEVHVAVGVEAGAVRVGADPAAAIGVAGGLLFVGDAFGLAPGAIGFTVAAPLWTAGLPAQAPVTAYLRWGPEF